MITKYSTIKSILLFSFILVLSLNANAQQPRPNKPKFKKDKPLIKTETKPTKAKRDISSKQRIPNTESDTSEIVNLEKASEIEGFKQGDEEIRFLKGDVVLTQGNVVFYCDSAFWYTKQNAILAWKNVTIVQSDTISIFSDSLRYFGETKDAYLIGNVVLSDTTQQLFTERLDYNLDTKIAEYYSGGLIKSKTTQLTSETGIYNTNTNDAFFKDSVLVINEEFTLKADSLNYNTETQFSDFIGPTLIIEDSAKIYCESGFYDYENNYAEFDKNPQYIKGDKIAVADFMRYEGELKKVYLEGNAKFREGDKFASSDKMWYEEETDITKLEGDAYYKDPEKEVSAEVIIYDGKNDTYNTEGKTIATGEGNYVEADNSRFDAETNMTILTGNVLVKDDGQILNADEVKFNDDSGDAFASGKVHWRDTVNNITIKSDDLYYNKETEYVEAIGRPIMTSLLDGDTLYLSADTLISEKVFINENDSMELLRAYRDVRVFKKDFQAVCDSMVYNSTDSLFSFYYNPVMWSDSTQFSADTTRFTLSNEKIDSVFLLNNALIVDTPDELFFNQIQGKNIIIDFDNNEPKTMNVNGNGISVYYVQEDDGGYVGPNKTTCSDMKIYFEEGDLNRIKFYIEPVSSMIPMKEANHEELKLKGFKWEKGKRPFSPADLNSPHYIVDEKIVLEQEIPN